jgi:hypothetical protein
VQRLHQRRAGMRRLRPAAPTLRRRHCCPSLTTRAAFRRRTGSAVQEGGLKSDAVSPANTRSPLSAHRCTADPEKMLVCVLILSCW